MNQPGLRDSGYRCPICGMKVWEKTEACSECVQTLEAREFAIPDESNPACTKCLEAAIECCEVCAASVIIDMREEENKNDSN